MIEPKASLPVRIWRGIWKVVSFIRASLANIIFLFFLIIFISAVAGNRTKPIPAAAPLFIAPSGPLVDQLTYAEPISLLLGGKNARDNQTSLRELIKVIDAAASDPRITALVLQLDYLADSGSAKMAELAEAILRFKSKQKPVIAYADYYSQQQYFLAAHADEIYINDMGGVLLNGIGLYRNYYKSALDKLSVKFHIFKVGTFKDFVEPYTRNDMSEASKQHNNEWMSELWSLYTNRVETQRKLEPGSINKLINSTSEALLAANNSTAQMALNAKLVDHVGNRVNRMEDLIKRFGVDPEVTSQFLHVNYNQYKHDLASKSSAETQGNIGLIVASGSIVDGEQPDGTIGGDTLAQLLRKARDDKDIKALIVRIDSGGGSAFASEIIRQEMQAVRAAGKKIYVSMGTVAASGGYWMASAADEIWATPFTITGSIGVFGMFPTVDEGLNKLGIFTDGVATHALSGAMRPDRPMDPTAEKIAQQGVESIYQRFLSLVSEARKRDTAEIDAIAQGRVWTGGKAQALGLVDQLGYLNDVVKAVAEQQKITTPKLKVIQRDLSAQEQLIRNWVEQSSHVQTGPLSQWFTRISNLLSQPALGQFNTFEQAAKPYGFSIMAACLDCSAL
ncbi:MAG TPA: signal peptide peptidase SppA [Cellvibrionaceae bacterium]|nr:signal peptide peptidase SppA [Cellvibrionaceae bacterium]HMW70230.1 signal peptide peptidase SppA [Cellvibrionaceae bacterium]HMY38372.1 signal peptide peptidase SppA [Marinagarivorans sp.]